jgi:hypothetical protein
VAASYDGTRVRFYVDGEAAGDFSLANNGVGPKFPLLNRGMASWYFKGWLDEVRLWSAALTQAEIRENLYREPRSGQNLKAAWPEGGGREALAIKRRRRATPEGRCIRYSATRSDRSRVPVVPQTDGIVDLSTDTQGAEQLVIRYKEGERVRDAVAYLVYRRTGFVNHWTLHVGIPAPSDTTGGQSRDQSWVGLLLDPNNSKDKVAQPQDFDVGASSVRRIRFTASAPAAVVCSRLRCAAGLAVENCEELRQRRPRPPSIEFEIFGALLGSLTETNGLAIGHHWISSINDSRYGPGDAVLNSPATGRM